MDTGCHITAVRNWPGRYHVLRLDGREGQHELHPVANARPRRGWYFAASTGFRYFVAFTVHGYFAASTVYGFFALYQWSGQFLLNTLFFLVSLNQVFFFRLLRLSGVHRGHGVFKTLLSWASTHFHVLFRILSCFLSSYWSSFGFKLFSGRWLGGIRSFPGSDWQMGFGIQIPPRLIFFFKKIYSADADRKTYLMRKYVRKWKLFARVPAPAHTVVRRVEWLRRLLFRFVNIA